MAVEKCLQVRVGDRKDFRVIDRANRGRCRLLVDECIFPETAARAQPGQLDRGYAGTALGQVNLYLAGDYDVEPSQPLTLVDDDFPGPEGGGFAGFQQQAANRLRYFFKNRGLREFEIANDLSFSWLDDIL